MNPESRFIRDSKAELLAAPPIPVLIVREAYSQYGRTVVNDLGAFSTREIAERRIEQAKATAVQSAAVYAAYCRTKNHTPDPAPERTYTITPGFQRWVSAPFGRTELEITEAAK